MQKSAQKSRKAIRRNHIAQTALPEIHNNLHDGQEGVNFIHIHDGQGGDAVQIDIRATFVQEQFRLFKFLFCGGACTVIGLPLASSRRQPSQQPSQH